MPNSLIKKNKTGQKKIKKNFERNLRTDFFLMNPKAFQGNTNYIRTSF